MKRLVALFDAHWPYSINAYYLHGKLSPVFQFLADFQPHIVIDGGDQLDLDCISHWNRGKPRLIESKRLLTDYETYNALLTERDRLLQCVEQHVMLEGNHERWVRDLIDEEPNELEGFIEIPQALHLKARGYTWVEQRQPVHFGKLYLMHGDYKDRYVPIFHARAIAQLYHRNIVYGHFHSEQSYIDVTPLDAHPVKAQSVGTLGCTNPMWRKNEANAWSNSFYVAYLMDDGNYNGFVVNIVDGRFIFDGQVYSEGRHSWEIPDRWRQSRNN